jgi:hypothetical protein
MPIPVIDPVQSVIGYLQWQAFGFQPSASETPTSWTCSPVAPGLYFNSTTGLISGAAILPGVYTFRMTATNGSGTSLPQLFVMGIEASGFVQPSSVMDCTIDVTSRRVSLTSVPLIGASSNLGVVTDDVEKLQPLFWVKSGDDFMQNVRFTKGGVAYAPDITGIKFTLKELEPEGNLVTSTAFARLGHGGESASWLVYTLLDSPKLRAALTNYEDDEATQFPALAEIEWVENNTLSTPVIGPATIRTSSRTFLIMLSRELIPNS